MAFNFAVTEALNPLKAAFSFRYTVISDIGGYFENVVKIGEISTYSVTLLFKKAAVKVCGENLRLGTYCDGDLTIYGNILKVEKC